MAVSAKFVADFSEFNTAVDDAVVQLGEFQAGVGRTDTDLQRFSTTTTTTGSSFTRFHSSLSHADKVLAAFGVNISRELQAIRELGEASGKTAGQIGLIGTAGLAVGATLGGWQVGRWIADTLDLDQAIGDMTAELLGWRDAGVEAAAASDTLAKASGIAGREITSMSEAVQIVIEHTEKMIGTHERASESTKQFVSDLVAQVDAINSQLDQSASLMTSFTGEDAINKANQYLEVINELRAQGLEPIKSKHEEIVEVMQRAIEAMKNMGMTGGEVYRDLIAMAKEFAGAATLDSSRIPGISGLITPPALGPGGNVAAETDALELQQQLIEFTEQYNTTLAESDALVKAYHDSQTRALGDGITATGELTAGFTGLEDAVLRASAAMKVMVPPDFSWVQAYRDAGLFVSDASIGGGRAQPRDLTETIGRTRAGSNITVNIDSRGAYYDTAESRQRHGEDVGNALLARLR